MTESSIRLNKYIALHKGVSRRVADGLIAKNIVAINGTPAPLGAHVSNGDVVTIKGVPVKTQTALRYIALHKPAGYVCSRRAQGDTPTIYALLPKDMHALKPVGRLDKDSSGVLLLTNDGDFAHRMTHPTFHKQKTYIVELDHDLAPLHQQMISDYGVQLEDGSSKLLLERRSDENRTEWTVLMHEGRNRQIRRTFAALGYTVTALHRTQFGNYSLGDIPTGKYTSVDIS
jgi:pseudouridine synthase